MDWILENLMLFWIILTVVFLVLEGMSAALMTIWFAGGSVAAMIVSLLTDSFVIQLIVFIVVSSILLILTRPLLVKRMDHEKIKTNVDSLLGEEGIIIKGADVDSLGQAKVKGQIWSVKSQDNEELIKGERVIVQKVEGVKLLVSKKS